MGRSLAIFQSSGYIPIERERLKMAVKNGDKISAAIYKTTLSGSVALLELMVLEFSKQTQDLLLAALICVMK